MENKKNALVVGGGVAGLSAALEMARMDVDVLLVEKKPVLGGHAAQYTCKAVEQCVKCGACMVEDKLSQVMRHPGVETLTGSRIESITGGAPYQVKIVSENGSERDMQPDVIVVATGFEPFDPANKPYGYNLFDNVVTNLDLERMLRETGNIHKPSDGTVPERIAFIQCVGSRDASINHLWCSRVCCGSALRMGNLIKSKYPDIEIVYHYIDIQTFGKDFTQFYGTAKQQSRFIRAIPGDIFKTGDDRLRVIYYDHQCEQSSEELFDMVVLSVGITPLKDAPLPEIDPPLPLSDSGFICDYDGEQADYPPGIFAAGTTTGPMSIPDAIAHGGKVAWQAVRYLDQRKSSDE